VGSFVSSGSSAVSSGLRLPTDEELEREVERGPERSRREAERILTQEVEECRLMEEKSSNEVNDSADLDTTTFKKYLSRLVSGAAGLAFQFARVRFKDGFSIVLDHDELWPGRGAFELRSLRFYDRGYNFDANIGLVANICRALVPMPSTVQSLLLEDGNRNSWQQKPDREGWRELFRVFDNVDVKTLRAAGRFVGELDKPWSRMRMTKDRRRFCPCCKRSCDMVPKTSLRLSSRLVRSRVHLYAS
jgi:hypothetical protein